MPVIFAKERVDYIGDQERDPAIREEYGAWQNIANPSAMNGSFRFINTDNGPGGVTYRFSARQFQLIGLATDGGFWALAEVVINGVAVTPYSSLATGTEKYAPDSAAPWFISPDYGRITAIVVTVRNCPGSRGIFDNGVKLIQVAAEVSPQTP